MRQRTSDRPRHHWLVPPELGGERLDRVAPTVMTLAGQPTSRRQIRRWIAEGRLAVEGHPVKVASRRVKAGARLTLLAAPADREPGQSGPPRAPAWEVIPDAVLFEDDHLLALDKPPGLASQARRDDGFDHLLAAGRRYLRSGPDGGDLFLVHRLDRGTSGVVLLAKDRATAAVLGTALAEGQLEKHYLALAAHDPAASHPAEAWTTRDHLAGERLANGRRRVRRVDSGGRPAETAFRLLSRFDHPPLGEALAIEAIPRTGRTHQIRVHLAESALPILGDRLYAPDSVARAMGRPMLHARSLGLRHPANGRSLRIESPLPDDFPTQLRV